MKNFIKFKFIFFVCIFIAGHSFVACNKDDVIIVDDPATPPSQGEPESPEIKLPYSVIEYMPAPGQYINETQSGFDKITSMVEACTQVQKRFSENLYVSLGSWGGYIIVKFSESIKNKGNFDFSISTNSFDTSSEAGIVWVMCDANGNGKPDDVWYELKGSYFEQEGYQRNFWVTYYRPEAKGDTEWIDSEGNTGIVNWMGSYHSQDYYYPTWIEKDSYTLYGSKLPQQAIQNPETGIWSNLPFAWGYADNFGEDFNSENHRNYFSLSNAVDSEGDSVDLTEIHFIKVQSAIMGSSGWLGEISTEICGFFSEN